MYYKKELEEYLKSQNLHLEVYPDRISVKLPEDRAYMIRKFHNLNPTDPGNDYNQFLKDIKQYFKNQGKS